MKKVATAILALSFVSTAAMANLKQPGTVEQSLCSTTVSTSSMVLKEIPKKVCLATIVGRDGQFLVTDNKVWFVRDADEQGQPLELQMIGNVGDAQKFQPLLQKILIRAQAIINGEGQEMKLLFVQSRANTFHAEEFKVMFRTLGLKF